MKTLSWLMALWLAVLFGGCAPKVYPPDPKANYSYNSAAVVDRNSNYAKDLYDPWRLSESPNVNSGGTGLAAIAAAGGATVGLFSALASAFPPISSSQKVRSFFRIKTDIGLFAGIMPFKDADVYYLELKINYHES